MADDDLTESVGGFDQEPDRPRIKKLGHFKIEATLGSGGMGTIYRAYDESMKRLVALKVLHSSLEISQRAQSRFVREAWIAGQLDHPNIIKVHSRGEENNVSYLAMELAEGGSLYDSIKQTQKQVPSGSDITETIDQDYIKDILAKFIELAGALEHIHSKDFIHRDIKPHNVLLAGEDKKFKFTDFGIAHAEDMTRMTKAGDFIGTVKYMSPELLAAHRAGIDKRTDIYSLGITLYEALTLTLPFKADSEEKLIGEILAGHYHEARKTNRRIPVDLETVLMKACHQDPDRRYDTASDFADDLQRIIDGRPILAKRPSVVQKTAKFVKRNYRAVIAAMLIIGIFAVTVWWALQKSDTVDDYRPSGPRFSKIDVPGLPFYCALSPDGEKIAFVPSDGCLWVAPTRGTIDPTTAGEPVRITDQLTRKFHSSLPVWSADRKWIAFNGWNTEDSSQARWSSMYVIPSDGGELREVPVKRDCSGKSRRHRISLSPNGDRIAFSSDASLIPGESKTRCVYMIPVDGGQITRLTDTLCDQPAFSPDGKMVAYVNHHFPEIKRGFMQSDIWIVPATGGPPIQVSDLPGRAFGPVWSPNSRAIVFNRMGTRVGKDTVDLYSTRELCVVLLSEDYKPKAPPVSIELPLTSHHFVAGWSSDNRIGIVLATPDRSAVFSVAARGGIAAQIAPLGSWSPSWSYDGKRIFYADDSAFFSMPVDGGQAMIIPISGMDDMVWSPVDDSPDGRTLVFAGLKEGDSVVHLYTVSADGGEPHQLTFGSRRDISPRWSPDGSWIAFQRGSDGSDICLIPAEGGKVRQLLVSSDSTGAVSNTEIAWSPDGKLITYSSYHESGCCLSALSLDGSNPEILVELEPGYTAGCMSWSSDGKRLCYGYTARRFEERHSEIMILDWDTRNKTKLRTGIRPEQVYYVDWSPDGETILFYSDWQPDLSLYLIEDFRPSSQTTGVKPPPEPTFTKIDVPGWTGHCALSPDGDRLAFVARDTCLWVAPLRKLANAITVGEPAKLTGQSFGWSGWELPVWSGDGNWITFNDRVRRNGPDYYIHSMYVVESSGGDPIELPVKPDGESFWANFRTSISPDGKEIAFYSLNSPITGDSVKSALYTVQADGGEIKRLTGSQCRQPAYSPDGEMLAYVKGFYDAYNTGTELSEIWVVASEGGDPIMVCDIPGVLFSPVWSPDSRKIVFGRWRDHADAEGDWAVEDLYIMGLSEKYRPIGPPVAIELPSPMDEFIVGWTLEDKIGLVLKTPARGAIYSIPVSGGIATQSTPTFADCPRWSPDGKRVYYMADTSIYIIPSDGGATAVPTSIVKFGPTYGTSFDISHDEKKLVIAGWEADDSTGSLFALSSLFTLSIEGGDALRITSDSTLDWCPTWSPSGEWIAYMRTDLTYTRRDLCLISPDGSETRVLVSSGDSGGRWDDQLAWSPDGKYIAYHWTRNDSVGGISMVSVNGGQPDLIMPYAPGSISSALSWSPDGGRICYATYSTSHSIVDITGHLWILPLDTKKPLELHTRHELGYISLVDWSPDGEKIAFSSNWYSDYELWLMEDFLPEEFAKGK